MLRMPTSSIKTGQLSEGEVQPAESSDHGLRYDNERCIITIMNGVLLR